MLEHLAALLLSLLLHKHPHHHRITEYDRAHHWAAQPGPRAVRTCESHGNYRAVSASGTYKGAWQADDSFYATYGDHSAPRADLASKRSQDLMAYRGWLARGFQPWTCATILGIR